MSSLYEIANHEGRWGFWCDAFEEEKMLELVGNGHRTVVGGFLHAEIGPRKVVAVGGDRKKIVSDLPRTRTFFALNPAPEDFSEDWPIDWLGHIRCFPYPHQQQIMLQTCDVNAIVASGNEPGNNGQKWAAVVEVLPGMLVPPTTCCDL